MLVRVLVLLLVVLNLGAIAWIVSTYGDVPPAVPQVEDGVPPLLLLSERNADLQAAAAPDTQAPARVDDVCLSIGPFSNTSDVRAAMVALTPLTRRIQFRDGQLERSRGWWVYLPTYPTQEEALEAARQLAERGIKDYYVVSAGDQQNTISLGLFRERSGAERRQAELQSLGLETQIGERTDVMPAYWIDFAQSAAAPVDWHVRVGADPAISARSIDCF